MKKNIGFVIVVVLCALFISSFKFPWQKHHANVPETISGKKHLMRIAIIGLPDNLKDRIIEHLVASKRFVPVERKALDDVLSEQRFGKTPAKSYLDKTLDKAIKDMDKIEGDTVNAVGNLAIYNDFLKSISDLGSAVGADYVILGNLEKLEHKQIEANIPYSKEKRFIEDIYDARLRIRIVEVKTATVVGATSFRFKIKDSFFEGKTTNEDEFSFLDKLGRVAASKILDVIFPARVVKLNPILISRGKNDGVRKGDIYIIKREGEKVYDSAGVMIGHLKRTVGKVKIIDVQETFSVAEKLSGRSFKVGDLAVFDSSSEFIANNTSIDGAGTVAKRSGKMLPNTISTEEHRGYTIAIGPIKIDSKERAGILSNNDVNIIVNKLIAKLSNTHRFRIMEREDVDQILKEKEFVSKVKDSDLKSMLKQLQGADYLIYGEIEEFDVDTIKNKVPYLNEVETITKGNAKGILRIVDVATGEIAVADEISVEFKSRNKEVATTEVKDALIDLFTSKAVSCIINKIFPIKVIGLSEDGFVYINRGKDGGLKVGDKLDLMKPGKNIRDIDTGLSFGQTEIKVGEVKIVNVESFRSKCKVISGQYPKIGYILRKSQQEHKALENNNEIKVIQPNW